MIYAFEVHFNAMFLAYCAVLGLSFYGLMGVREFLAPDEVAKRYAFGAPVLMVMMVLISLEGLALIAVFERKGLPTDPTPVIFFGASATFLTVLLVWFLRSARKPARRAGALAS